MDKNKAIKLIQGIEEDGRNVTSEHIEALSYAVSHLETDRWIPVSERLPEDFLCVLVYCPQFDNVYCVFRECGDWHRFSHFDMLMETVTHWRPLPKSPESEDK